MRVEAITTLKAWPGKNGDKVSSDCAYPPGGFEWGYEVSEKHEKMMWNKMRLAKQPCKQELEWILSALNGMKDLKNDPDDPPTYPKQKPDKVVADYLTCIREHLVAQMELSRKNILDHFPTELIFTVPAVGSASL